MFYFRNYNGILNYYTFSGNWVRFKENKANDNFTKFELFKFKANFLKVSRKTSDTDPPYQNDMDPRFKIEAWI